MKVLIIDDEPDILKLNRYILQSMQYEVYEAGNGKEGINLFQTQGNDIDLVILDLTMPVMDGMETFNVLRKLKPDLPIILITGFDDLWDLDQLTSQKNVKFIRKPYQMDDLLSAIESLGI